MLAVEWHVAPKMVIFVTVCSIRKTKVAETGIFVVFLSHLEVQV